MMRTTDRTHEEGVSAREELGEGGAARERRGQGREGVFSQVEADEAGERADAC